VGTAAWLFFITNFFKLPFHIWVWQTISVETLWIDLKLFPIMVLGLFSGLVLVRKINEKNYKRFILVVTAFGALVFLLR
ncbi:MAG: sulfite exporter TauE/SafE family protein, partial [Bacteroidota bacterium]